MREDGVKNGDKGAGRAAALRCSQAARAHGDTTACRVPTVQLRHLLTHEAVPHARRSATAAATPASTVSCQAVRPTCRCAARWQAAPPPAAGHQADTEGTNVISLSKLSNNMHSNVPGASQGSLERLLSRPAELAGAGQVLQLLHTCSPRARQAPRSLVSVNHRKHI